MHRIVTLHPMKLISLNFSRNLPIITRNYTLTPTTTIVRFPNGRVDYKLPEDILPSKSSLGMWMKPRLSSRRASELRKHLLSSNNNAFIELGKNEQVWKTSRFSFLSRIPPGRKHDRNQISRWVMWIPFLRNPIC